MSWFTDSIGLGTTVLTLPVSVLAYGQIRTHLLLTRKEKAEKLEKAEIAATLRQKAERDAEMDERIKFVLAQVTPSNGVTVAESVEQSLAILNERTKMIADIGGEVRSLRELFAAHVADGHGGVGVIAPHTDDPDDPVGHEPLRAGSGLS